MRDDGITRSSKRTTSRISDRAGDVCCLLLCVYCTCAGACACACTIRYGTVRYDTGLSRHQLLNHTCADVAVKLWRRRRWRRRRPWATRRRSTRCTCTAVVYSTVVLDAHTTLCEYTYCASPVAAIQQYENEQRVKSELHVLLAVHFPVYCFGPCRVVHYSGGIIVEAKRSDVFGRQPPDCTSSVIVSNPPRILLYSTVQCRVVSYPTVPYSIASGVNDSLRGSFFLFLSTRQR